MLEIGPLASWVPSVTHIIQSYAYEAFPNLAENLDTPVVAITRSDLSGKGNNSICEVQRELEVMINTNTPLLVAAVAG